MSEALATIYSRSDAFKRKLIDALRNPRLAVEQMVGDANDRARSLNEMTSAAAQEGVNFGPASQALGQKLADSYNPMGITVWHGSPHGPFAKFDASKIGSGEGAQVYGRGHYTAESKDVAQEYANKLSGTGKGNLYKIDLPDEHVANMVDWDKKFPEQAPAVQDKIKAALELRKRQTGGYGLFDPLEQTSMADLLGSVGEERLAQSGIPGVRYFDQYSRVTPPVSMQQLQQRLVQAETDLPKLKSFGFKTANQEKLIESLRSQIDQYKSIYPDKTRNFVVFPGNEHMMKIEEVNGQPIIDALRKRKPE